MQNLLVDLLVESEACTLTAFRLAKALGLGESDEHEKALFRIGTAVGKFYVTKRQPQFVYECMEAMGGNGYTEDFPLARNFRQSPLNSIWEGSGNVICLDILRAASLMPVLLEECRKAACMDSAFDKYVQDTEALAISLLKNATDEVAQMGARYLADRLAVSLQGSLVLRYGDERLAKAFLASRIRGEWGHNYGTLAAGVCDASVVHDNIARRDP
jgi:putative acyl-CoA dehydrogenase